MTIHSTLHAIGLVGTLAAFGGSMSAHAADIERIRPESTLLRAVMSSAFDRSSTFRALIERIEDSDVMVHLTCEEFTSTQLLGRTLLASAGPSVRYLRIQIRCRQSFADLAAIVGHELQHVVEIASATEVVDDRSFHRLFARIGFPSCLSLQGDAFETTAAVQTGDRVRQEFVRATGPRPPPAGKGSVWANREGLAAVDRHSH